MYVFLFIYKTKQKTQVVEVNFFIVFSLCWVFQNKIEKKLLMFLQCTEILSLDAVVFVPSHKTLAKL